MTAIVLLIDDDSSMVQTARSILPQEGYDVRHSPLGRDALRHLLMIEPDLVILGLGPPDGSWSFLHQVMPLLECPLMALLPERDEVACAQALELGADDCLAHPIAPVELVARIRALLRRGRPADGRRERSVYVDGDLVVDLTRREAKRGDEWLPLSRTEFDVLACLIQSVGHVLPHQRLIEQVWGPDCPNAAAILRQYIHHLRRKIEPDPKQPRRIVSRRQRGYVLHRIAR